MATRLQYIIAVFLLGLLCLSTCAQSAEPLNSRLDKLRGEGYNALYNLDYNTARQRFTEMIELAPDHPVGPQCIAASLWLQQLNESLELKATLYSSKSYAQENKKLNEARAQEFRKWIRQAKSLSKARLQKDSRDQEALYFLGAAEGLESAFSAAVERKFMAALRSGSDSVDHHRALLKLDPDFRDAELTIGLYNYIVGALPLPLKILVGSMGVRGSKKRGLETLERVSREGKWARDVARVLLVDLYKRDKRWPEAIAVSRELANKYQRNYLFKLQLADALTAEALTGTREKLDSTEQVRIFESLLVEQADDAAVIDLVHFRYGETLLLLNQTTRAMKEFQFVLGHSSAEPVLRTMSRLRLAQCLDAGGKREEAISMYRHVLSSQQASQFEDEAKRGLREPYRVQNRNE